LNGVIISLERISFRTPV